MHTTTISGCAAWLAVRLATIPAILVGNLLVIGCGHTPDAEVPQTRPKSAVSGKITEDRSASPSIQIEARLQKLEEKKVVILVDRIADAEHWIEKGIEKGGSKKDRKRG
jgi:hypothetical protein